MGWPASIWAEEMGFIAAALRILSPDMLYVSTSSADSLTSLLVLLGLEKFVLSHFALQKPLWRRGFYCIEAEVWLGLATSSRPDLVLYAIAFTIPMTAETKFLIGRALAKVGIAKEDLSKPPLYSAWFILKQLSFHAFIVGGTVSGALWLRWGLWMGYSQKLSLYPRVFFGEEPWHVF
jgi:Gpi18-like mannosyltransferase